ncbi:hypothetical protein J5J86_23905 [Aquabacter sp. L1I39]|uniref:hypothetical protein n=1 Tax=Aquabacter sp. L1I39 TaxID=2820278 RepID=UPI001AD9E67D|nr:hypothetical protein [Aquabacter sp. L1I39]QTL03729.1 hypothetical protein J5J86_23905 [Aquabacter sp. L1I39]
MGIARFSLVAKDLPGHAVDLRDARPGCGVAGAAGGPGTNHFERDWIGGIILQPDSQVGGFPKQQALFWNFAPWTSLIQAGCQGGRIAGVLSLYEWRARMFSADRASRSKAAQPLVDLLVGMVSVKSAFPPGHRQYGSAWHFPVPR